MEFKKYSSLENTYNSKFLHKFLIQNPDAEKEVWVAREKIDGANIQLVFTPNEPMRVGSRNQWVNEGDSFYDIWTVIDKYKAELLTIQEEADRTDLTFRVYGEIYGQGVQNRIDYGPEKRICFFDVETINYVKDVNLYTQNQFENFIEELDLVHMLPKSYGTAYLQDLLVLDVEQDNIEGIVIKPYHSNFFLGDSRVVFKKKSARFKDKEGNDKVRIPKPGEDKILFLNLEFRKYITKNRVLDCFSKNGPIQDQKEMGKYIKLVLEDAKIDFLKDVDLASSIENYEPKMDKQIFNVGGDVANLLKEHL